MPKHDKAQAARHHEYQRDRILAAARELFARDGYEAVTMRRIASLIGQTPTTLYRYFRNKSDILTCLCEDFFAFLVQDLQETLSKVVQTDLSAQQQLRAGLQSFIRISLQYPEHYKAAFLSAPPPAEMPPCTEVLSSALTPDSTVQPQEQIAQVVEMSATFEQAALSLLVDGVRMVLEKTRKSTSAETLRHVSNSLWAALHGAIAICITMPSCFEPDREQTLDTLLNILLAGMTALPPAQPPSQD